MACCGCKERVHNTDYNSVSLRSIGCNLPYSQLGVWGSCYWFLASNKQVCSLCTAHLLRITSERDHCVNKPGHNWYNWDQAFDYGPHDLQRGSRMVQSVLRIRFVLFQLHWQRCPAKISAQNHNGMRMQTSSFTPRVRYRAPAKWRDLRAIKVMKTTRPRTVNSSTLLFSIDTSEHCRQYDSLA